jgi:hypothetical protein
MIGVGHHHQADFGVRGRLLDGEPVPGIQPSVAGFDGKRDGVCDAGLLMQIAEPGAARAHGRIVDLPEMGVNIDEGFHGPRGNTISWRA